MSSRCQASEARPPPDGELRNQIRESLQRVDAEKHRAILHGLLAITQASWFSSGESPEAPGRGR